MLAIALALAMQPAAQPPEVPTWCWRCPPRERRFNFEFDFRPPQPTQPIYIPPAPVFPIVTPYFVQPQYSLPAYYLSPYQPGGFSIRIRQGRP